MLKISIITINRNNKVGLTKTIQSVLVQSYRNYEYIVIDGDSDDGSVDVIKQFANQISYWITEPDNGIYHAMNKGILKATGDYCLFLNSGDGLLHENVLQELCLIPFDEDIVYGNIIKLYPGKNQRDRGIAKSEISLYNLSVDRINHQATLIKRNLFDKFGLYSEEFQIASDWKFFLDAIIVGNASVKYIDKDISFFDINGMSSVRLKEAYDELMQILCSTFPPRVLAVIWELFRYKHSKFVCFYDRLIENKFLMKIYNMLAHGKSKQNS